MTKTTRGTRQARYVSKLAVFAPSVDAMFDSMRYDGCYPETEAEAAKMSAMATNPDLPDSAKIIRLIMVAAADRTPTYDHWRSYGCFVLAAWGTKDPGPSDAELERLLVLTRGEPQAGP